MPTSTPPPDPNGCQLLANGDFESGLANWRRNGTLILSTNPFEGSGALDVTNGWAGQIVDAQPNTPYTLSGYYQTTGNAGWVGVGIDYLDVYGREIGENLVRFNSNVSPYTYFEVNGTSPAGTAKIQVWLFSSYGGNLLVDNVKLSETDCDGPAPTPTPTVAPPTPTPTQVPGICELITNGGFEAGQTGWTRYGQLQIVSDTHTGNGALSVTSGWAGQIVPANGQTAYTLSGYYRTTGNAGWVGVGIDYLNSSGVEIGENLERFAPGVSSYTPFEVEGFAPAGTVEIRVWLYSTSGGHLIVDDVSLIETDCDGTSPTPTATPPSPTATPGPVACGPMSQEAEAGTISGSKFVIGNHSSASGGQYVYVPDGEGNISSPVPTNQDYVSYCFDIPAAGEYKIEGWVWFEGTRHLSDSFFVQVDDAPTNGYLWDIRKANGFVVDYVSDRRGQDPVIVYLSAGEHIVKVHLREDGTLLDKLSIVAAD